MTGEGRLRLFDTHAHYDDRAFREDRDALVSSLPRHGVELVVCPGCDLASSRACVELAGRHAHVYAAVGVHPSEAHLVPPGWVAALEAMAAHPKVRAIGEIGLDYHWKPIRYDEQLDVLRAQLALAERLDLPVIIHDREAHRDCLEAVRSFPRVRGVYHCYSGSLEDAKTLVEMGWMLSFTGVVTYKNARRALEVLEWLPLDRLMLETDSPYLPPEPFRGRRNDSTRLYRVAEAVAQVKGLTPEQAAQAAFENGKRFFRIEDRQ